MSWKMRKAGMDKEKLKQSVQAESAPQLVKTEINARIDALDMAHHNPGCIIVVESRGHVSLDSAGTLNPERPFHGVSDILIEVQAVPFINT